MIGYPLGGSEMQTITLKLPPELLEASGRHA